MKLEALESLSSFALLGPGFGGRGYTLLKGLKKARPGGPGGSKLVFAAFEDDGARPQVFRAGSIEPLRVEWPPLPPPLKPVLRTPGYATKVDRIRRAIAAGDVYQVCLCERARFGRLGGAQVLARMAGQSAPRFSAWVRLPGGREFVSASPELFFETQGLQVHSQPMKGTAAPGREGRLRSSAKDQAELAMITDLVRNDLAPVCVPKSVRVSAARRFLKLAYAVQSVSDVRGRLAKGQGPLQVLAALHPGGSVTGAPKPAALRMIRSLEAGPRAAYCGALGFWRGPRSVFSLLIRTAEKRADGWDFGVGSGIVYDSRASRERAELDVKLGALAWPSPR